jgi:hypothetical protein
MNDMLLQLLTFHFRLQALTIVFNVAVVHGMSSHTAITLEAPSDMNTVIKYNLGYRDYDVSLKYFLQFKLMGWIKVRSHQSILASVQPS